MNAPTISQRRSGRRSLPQTFARKSVNLERIADTVARRPELLQQAFDGLNADTARVKFGCLKLLRIISENQPEILYPEISRLFRLLDNNNKIIQWGAILCIGNLAAVDSKRKIERKLGSFLQPIRGDVMITAANVIRAAGQIARAKPHLAGKIAEALLRVETSTYQTPECRNVALGHTIKSLDSFFGQIKHPRPVIEFVRRQLENPRNAVRRKADQFLKKRQLTRAM